MVWKAESVVAVGGGRSTRAKSDEAIGIIPLVCCSNAVGRLLGEVAVLIVRISRCGETICYLSHCDQWDYANRLIALGSGGATTTYGYDAFGSRVFQTTAT